MMMSDVALWLCGALTGASVAWTFYRREVLRLRRRAARAEANATAATLARIKAEATRDEVVRDNNVITMNYVLDLAKRAEQQREFRMLTRVRA